MQPNTNVNQPKNPTANRPNLNVEANPGIAKNSSDPATPNTSEDQKYRDGDIPLQQPNREPVEPQGRASNDSQGKRLANPSEDSI